MSADPASIPTVAPNVSVLIVNYNGLRFLEDCLSSIKTAFIRYTYEIVVVDNASIDGSQAFLKNRNDISYIASDKNLGFTGGNNLAGRHARGQVLLLLNNDTCIERNLDPLIDEAMSEQVGAVGAHLVYGNARLQFSMGLDHTPLRLICSWLGLEKRHSFPNVFRRIHTDPGFYSQPQKHIAWVSGACLATRRGVWEALGGLDEDFFMYCEDVDYCLRVRKAGYTIAYVPDTLVTHYEGAGRPWIGQVALMRTCRSYQTYLTKHHSAFVAKITSLGLATVFLMRSAGFALTHYLGRADAMRKEVTRQKISAYLAVAIEFSAQAFIPKARGRK